MGRARYCWHSSLVPGIVIDYMKYKGQGGLSGNAKHSEDQKLERGNLALKNSISVKHYVRVIPGSTEI
ncbi:hypothetical protein AgCh_027016 [Apium graveolens]